MKYFIGSNVDRIYKILSEQIKRGYCFECDNDTETHTPQCADCEKKSKKMASQFISNLPELRRILTTDVAAAYEGDPAARSYGEAIFCYPSLRAITNQRISHELFRLEVPLIPRIITEMAHSETGIDVHPGAKIGEHFFIDHGTGVVIGETCVIGHNVQLYQGVTLGAKSFPKDKDGNPIKGIVRHPKVEDNVIIYAGATVLGRITIGEGSIIGGNVWVTDDVAKNGRILQTPAMEMKYESGGGI